ncbi:mucin-binding protein, partial [Limosilactobacillus vaginalis]|uniref:mucin-binding protein n=1 Tax=Limosilactobacillus vaginalis TaxID=1633 RepID=UPI00241C4223
MVSRNNLKNKMEADAKRVPHWSLRKLSIGVASVLLGTTLFFGMGTVANADTTVQNASTETTNNSATQAEAGQTSASTQTLTTSSANTSANASQLNVSLAATPNNSTSSANANNELKAVWNNTINYQYATSDDPNWQSNGLLKPQKSGLAANSTIFHLDATNVHSKNDHPVAVEQGNVAGTPTLLDTVDPYTVTGSEGLPSLDPSHQYVKFVYNVPLQQDFGPSYIGPAKFTSTLYADKTNGTLVFVSPSSTTTIPVYQVGMKTKIHYHSTDGYDQTVDGPIVYADGKSVDINYNVPEGYVLSDTRQLTKLSETVTVSENGRYTVTPQPNGNGFSLAKNSQGSQLIGLATIDVPLQKLQAASVAYQFVDDDNNGANVGEAHTVSGYVGKSASVSLTVPENYQLATGQTLPTSVNFTQEGNTQTKIHLVHQTEPVPNNDPSLNRDVKRVINVTNPNNEKSTETQTVTLHRTGTKDKVTGEVTYGSWGTGTWKEYNIPAVPGYTPDQAITTVSAQSGNTSTTTKKNAPVVASQNVTNEIGTVTVDVTYSPAEQNGKISYVDLNGKEVGNTPLTGTTGDTITITPQIPAGWKQVPNQEVPSTVTAGADGIPTVTIKVEHATTTVTPDHPKTPADTLPDNPGKKYPSGVAKDDLNKTIVRTIIVHTPGATPTTLHQDAKLTRTATVDEVTGEVTYGEWSTGNWDVYNVPAVSGYKPSQSVVEAQVVTGDTESQTVDITYTADQQNGKISYVDPNGKEVGSTPLTGTTGETITVTPQIPAGWKQVPNQEVPSTVTAGADGIPTVTIKVEHATTTVTPDHPKTPADTLPDNPGKKYPSGVAKDDLNKTIVRTIIVHTPGATPTTLHQDAKLTRTATVDEVTGEVTYGEWSTGNWDAYNVPTVAGYTPSQTTVQKVNVTSETQPATVDITYSPAAQTGKISYVDPNGKEVSNTPLTGTTGDTITVTPQIPAGWKQVPNQEVPSTVTAGADGIPTVTIKVEHATTTVTPDHPKTPADTLPDNPGKKYPSGVAKDDLNKTVTRTINVKKPNGTITKIQNVRLSRTATVDEVTGEVTYGEWSTGNWDAYNVPVVSGYKPSQSVVKAQVVTGDTESQTVDITYNANTQKGQIIY